MSQINPEKGKFVISLDFELLWGVFDVIDFEKKQDYFKNTRLIIPHILSSFKKFSISVTWATVGMLFNKNWEEWNMNMPADLPDYTNPYLSAYRFGKQIQNKKTEKFCFAPDLIKQISETPGQEIGTHTYSHYYCLEPGEGINTFKADLRMAVNLAKNINITLDSLVFPRNQIKEEYLEVCNKMGIKNVRSNPSSWYWEDVKSNSLLSKLGRTGDAYLPFGKKTYLLFEQMDNKLPLKQPSSRFLRPVEKNSFLRKLKLKRIFSEMTSAAQNKEIYHLWWHPHNFGDQPEESLKDLNLILNHFHLLNKKYGFQSVSMNSLNQSFI